LAASTITLLVGPSSMSTSSSTSRHSRFSEAYCERPARWGKSG
jgi:hypothetical protein